MKEYKVPVNFINKIIAPACHQNQEIIEAFKAVPREYFVDEAMRGKAYTDNALPIGFGQTISQPGLVASMLYALEINKSHKCLEIGFGSGFLTALLSKLAGDVVAMELLAEFYDMAKPKVRGMRANNVRLLLANGAIGYPDGAPYDRIIASAGANDIPVPLIEQLKVGGIMVIPVKNTLFKVTKQESGEIVKKPLANVAFVDFVHS